MLGTLTSWDTVAALWIGFLAYWAVSALRVKRTERVESLGARLATMAVLALAVLLTFSRNSNFGPLSQRFLPERSRIKLAAIALQAVGIVFAIWARRHLGEFWSARITLKENHQLIQSGPYARMRHPIYSGVLLAMLGTALFVGEWRALVGATLVFVGHWQKARREEAWLAEQFGSAYEEYRKRTGSLVPRLR